LQNHTEGVFDKISFDVIEIVEKAHEVL